MGALRALGRFLRAAWLAAVSLAFIGLFAAVVDLVSGDGAQRLPTTSLGAAWPMIGEGLAMVSVLAAASWWLALRGPIRTTALVFVIAGLGAAGAELHQTDIAVRSAVATAGWSYSLKADPAHGRLRIEGPIGPHFGAAFERAMARMPGPVRIEITSQGGLVNEAMRAGRAIAARPGTTVVARGWCASACMIVLMSGDNRLADARTRLAFHAIAPVVASRDPWSAWSLSRQRRNVEGYLIARGAPPELLARADRLGPRRMVLVTPRQALDDGVLTGLLRSDRPLRVARPV